jgi:tRNA/rRNA methyltransferase
MNELDNIRIVLLSPLYGGNVGSVCRAMANMGVSDLAIAAPRRLDMQEAAMMACHASSILEGRTEYPTLSEALADCVAVLGTSARPGLYRQHARTPREWAPWAIKTAGTGRVAILFGPEDNGLTNEDLALCTHIIRIPSTDTYSSLNVAQAVMVCVYELFVALGTFEPPEEKAPPAPSELRERMFMIWRDMMLKVGFMKEEKAEHMMLGLRRVFSRGAVTVDDVNILMGIARQASWAADHLGDKQAGTEPTED